MSTIGYAIHSIMLKDSEVAPGTVMEFSEETYDELDQRGAVRMATPAEVAVYLSIKASESAAIDAVSPERVALEALAKSLGVKFQKNTSDETLLARIEAAKASVAPSLDV